MKKTDKIEIRVSPEEKAALAQLSQLSGRTISDTVRGLLASHIATVAPAVENAAPITEKKKMSTVQKVAYASGGVVVGALAMMFTATAAAPPKPKEARAYSVHVELMAGPADSFRRFLGSSVIPMSRTTPTTLKLPIDNTYAYQVNISLKEQADGTVDVNVLVCKESATGCTKIAEPSTVAGNNQVADIHFAGDGHRIDMELRPTMVILD